MSTPSVTPASKPLDPLTLPLQGLQVIEASAGTGKTWTLAALYVRLVLGHVSESHAPGPGLYPPQILVMTFTEAATAELRGRIRERLSQAAHFFGRKGAEGDDFLRKLRASLDEPHWAACAYRLDMAAQWMDDAAIFTIHGWSSRMLKTHAFDSASLFQQSRVEDSDRLKLTAVQDYWRRWFYPLSADELEALQSMGASPDDLLSRLAPLWALQDQAPAAPADAADLPAAAPTPETLVYAWMQWQQGRDELQAPARAAWTQALVAHIQEAAASKLIKGYRPDWLAGWLAQMDRWVQGEGIKLETLQRFSASRLLEKGWARATDHPALVQLDALCDHLSTEPAIGPDLLTHAAREIGAAYQQAKSRLAQFDFSDLLQNLYHALQAPDGRLAQAIRLQFPVALVDEFQDTDPWQYGALSTIYAPAKTEVTGTGLIMIGDPKQAIYSFRGADLDTYLTARQQAQAIHTLAGNYRSTTGVVAAVNHVFSHAQAPFGDVPFEPVLACNPKVHALKVGELVQPAMTVWQLPTDRARPKATFLRDMAELFAGQMVALLHQGAARPGDMAVLVRGWTEARAIRQALAARGVRSVYLSERDSVFASPQATDLWRLLRAVAQPRSTPLIKAALCTSLWGLSWQALETLFQSEQAWDELTERFHTWQQVWQRQGFLPMLHQWLHEQAIPARLLGQDGAASGQGERQLTNLLHLGDLLQTASLGLQGEGALIRYLEDQLRHPQASGETAQLRLESDANLVQVITMHKSKGLQYPLVFLPFVAGFRAETSDSGKDDARRLSEDIRLLYVAMTRAEQALWMGVAPFKGDMDGKTPKVKSALSSLLGRRTSDDLADCLAAWACADIVVLPAPAADTTRYTPTAPTLAAKGALTPQRRLSSLWWTASFSALTQDLAHPTSAPDWSATPQDDRLSDAQLDSAPGVTGLFEDEADEPATPDLLTPFNAFPAGSTYGTLLHDVLEWQAQKGWPAVQAEPVAALGQEWDALLTRKATALGLSEADLLLLRDWVPTLLTATLPLAFEGDIAFAIVLGAISPRRYWAEMSFSLSVQSAGSGQLDRLIAQHCLPGQPRAALATRHLSGMLTGFIDLVFEHDGRYFVLDYKSNKLPAYGPDALAQAILAHRYDVQYTLYLLALHRLLKSRLPHYDYDQHMGGAVYLFLRGIDQPGAGVFTDRPPKALIEALDAVMSGAETVTSLNRALS